MTFLELISILAALACLMIALGSVSASVALRREIRRLRRQIGEERVQAADEQSRIMAVIVASAGHEVALKALDAARGEHVVQPTGVQR